MVQLWVNLPAKDKMTPPRYQGITNASIPKVSLANDSGFVRVIAGSYLGQAGPAKTFTPINMWDIQLAENTTQEFVVPADHTAAIVVLNGHLTVGDKSIEDSQVGILERNGDRFTVHAVKETRLLFLGGQPINESIVGYGPFVMNTQREIEQAIEDFQAGRMGNLAPIPGSTF
jgi:redox-sensitive bicupin YhaK (pirin superfamily)